MPSIKVPTVKQYNRLIGRTGFGKIFKTKNDHGEILEALGDFEQFQDSMAMQATLYLRQIRKECVKWLAANNGVKRASRTTVTDTFDRANERYLALMELYHHDEAKGTNVTQAEAVSEMPKRGRTVGNIGKALDPHLAKEVVNPMHLGPRTTQSAEALYRRYYTDRGGKALSMGAWYKHIYPADIEDGLSQVALGVGQQSASFNKALGGVKYCTPEERAPYVREPRGDGCLYDISGSKFDTTGMRTHFSEYGWSIFVLGFDNQLYCNTHEVDIFHHSSFFAGNPVQCGGEICCIDGQIRYLTAKTGHYKSSYYDFYRLLHFLSYHGVDLTKILACPEPWKYMGRNSMEMFVAAEVFAHQGRTSEAGPSGFKVPVVRLIPPTVGLGSVPAWVPM